MDAVLYRYNRQPDYILGVSDWGNFQCHTMERPWIEAATPGGKPRESCVPFGTYDLIPFARPNQEPNRTNVYALVNPNLGVHMFEADVPAEGGRFLILIHVANFITDVVGCIGPGLAQPSLDPAERLVGASAPACNRIFKKLDRDEKNTLKILPLGEREEDQMRLVGRPARRRKG